MKKFLTYFLVILTVLALAFTGCSKKSEDNEVAEETAEAETQDSSSGEVICKVTEIDGTTVTLQLLMQVGDESGEMVNPEDMPADGTMPEMPDGDVTPGDMPADGTMLEMPDGMTPADGTPPEKPEGEEAAEGTNNAGEGMQNPADMSGEMPAGETPPELPDGGSEGQVDPGEMPIDNPMESENTLTVTIEDTSIIYKLVDGEEVAAELSDITVGTLLKVTYVNDTEMTKIVIGSESDFGVGNIDQKGGNGENGENAPSGNTSEVVYGGATEITSAATESDKTYSTETADESALLISTSEAVTIENPTVSKSGDSDGGDNCNFYGQNAALLVKDGSTTTITGGTITSSATGANGVFSYGGNGGQNGASGDGTTVIISDTTITTTGSGSGGIMTTGGGVTQASNLTVTTSGQSSAAIRTDRGGGTVTVDGGTYTTNGLGSPAIYSTADITVSNATLVSNLSEGVCIEGLNSIELNNVSLTANNTKCNGNATFNDSIMIYQSMSGDAASGNSTFTMNGGSLTSKNGHVFHVTNTSATITLKGVTIVNEDSDNILLSVCDDGWSGGSNVAVLNAEDQALSGAILVGSNSTLTMSLTSGSTFNGYISGNIQNAAGTTVSTEVGTVSVTLDSDSTWTLTGDSYVTSFTGDASNVISNGYTLYVNGVALEGTK